MDEEGIPPTALREISLLQMLSNSIYIVCLICVQHIHHNDKPLLYLVFEYLDTDLKKFIDSHRKGPNPSHLPPSQIQSFLFQLCKGVAHCHGHDVLHRDLKPQNLLVDKISNLFISWLEWEKEEHEWGKCPLFLLVCWVHKGKNKIVLVFLDWNPCRMKGNMGFIKRKRRREG
ncbi:unnamed protein product [Lactuca virosa]|uniref:cyclin-dependent kinase n=1 Tax=Lactuca virosa TaxID=75947 RepID=A0AAU9M7T0_9ASTR|nr:unnamed protein product [Lactuca virosa]